MIKLALINRGVPGSGKSSFITTLKEMAPEKSIDIHCTDDLWMVDGKYMFDFKLLGEKHRENYDNFKESVLADTDIVICDNTNIRAREYNKYVEIAKRRGYHVIGVVFYPDSIDKHNERNTHNVPIEVLSKMKDNLLHNFQTVGADDEYVIQPEQGGPNSERVKNVINRILKT